MVVGSGGWCCRVAVWSAIIVVFFFLMIRRPPRSTQSRSSAASDVYKRQVVLQGIIDCWFEEEGKLVLVDYKTDYVTEGEVSRIKEKYRTQIEYYARALSQITGKEVSGKYIYLFWNGKILEY